MRTLLRIPKCQLRQMGRKTKLSFQLKIAITFFQTTAGDLKS